MTSRESDKLTSSKLRFKGQTFDMPQMDSVGKTTLNGTGPGNSENTPMEKKKTNLVFKKSNDFNPEAMAGGESKQSAPVTNPSVPQFTPTPMTPFIPNFLNTGAMQSPQQPQFAAMNAGTPMTNGAGMMSPPMVYPQMWTGGMMMPGLSTQVPTATMNFQVNPNTVPGTPGQASLASNSAASTPNNQYKSSDKLRDRWREKMLNAKTGGEVKPETVTPVPAPQKIDAPPAKEEAKKVEPKKEEAKPEPKKEDPKAVETKPAAKVDEDDSSDDSGDSGVVDRVQDESDEEVDYSQFPQERPRKIIYTREMILEFINKEAAREDKDLDEQFDDLMRDITIVNKARDYRDSKPRIGGGGGGKKDYKSGPRDKPKYPSRSEYITSSYNEPKGPSAALQRQKMTSAEKKRYQEIKQSSSDLLTKAKDDDIKTRQKKEINLYLFQLTPENYEEVSEKLMKYCYEDESCQLCVHMLIDKAWNQTKYTELYARLCSDLGSIKFGWFDELTEDKKEEMQKKYGDKEMDCQKIYKSFVLTKVRKEFNSGFTKFKDRMAKAESNEEYSDEDKTAEYNKAKGKVLANMSFIGELYKRKYLPHKVMRTITYQILNQFIEDYCKESTMKTLFSTSEVFVESFFRLMEICGEQIESKEKKDDMKKTADQITYQKQKADDYSKIMMSMIANKTYNKDDLNRVLSDEDRKNLNPPQIVFVFLRALKDSKKISPRLSSLIENAEENRKKGWRLNKGTEGPKKISEIHKEAEQRRDKQATAGRRGRYEDDDYYRGGGGGRYGGGGRGGKYGDEDDYYRKDRGDRDRGYGRADVDEYVKVEATDNQPRSSKLDSETTDGLIKAIFATTKSSSLADYTPQFSKDNKDIEKSAPEDVITSFFKYYTECSASIADVRTAIPITIINSFGLTDDEFFSAFTKSCNNLKYEDIPFLKKTMGKVLAYVLADCGFNLNNMAIEWPADEDDKEELLFFMQGVLDEAQSSIKSLEKDPQICDHLSAYSKSKLK